MSDFVSGMLTAGYLVAGLFFLKFHRKAGDRLFLMFAVAMWVLAAQRAVLSTVDRTSEVAIYLYGLRVVAFLIIIAAIVDKNRRSPTE